MARKPRAALFFAVATALLFSSGSPTHQIPMEMTEYLRSSGMSRPSDLLGTFTVKYSVSGTKFTVEDNSTNVTKSLSQSGTLTYHFDGESEGLAGMGQKGHVYRRVHHAHGALNNMETS